MTCRDFFLSSLPDRASILRAQFQDLDAQSRQALSRLEQLEPNGSGHPISKAQASGVLEQAGAVPDSMASAGAPAAYQFIQQEIVPRRNAVYDALQQITEEDQAALQRSEVAVRRQSAGCCQKASVHAGTVRCARVLSRLVQLAARRLPV